jgi:uncharacterized membrane protein YkoI/ferric-dicitrate binding protein FerR (iron transport regulator)
MDATRFEELLMRWQDGDASAADIAEFEGLLRDHAEFRQALVGSVLLEAGLHRRYTAMKTATPAPARKRTWEAAAALLVVAVSLFAVGRLMFRGDDLRIVSGAVWSQGAPAAALRDGQAFEIRGLAPATVQLRDGTRVILDAGSAGTLPAAAKPFELSRGSGSFQIDAAAFRLSTPAGGFTASNAQVWVLLRPSTRKAVKRPELVVETARGSVDVDAWDLRATVPAGSRRVFGPPPPPGGNDYAAILDRATFSLSAAIGKALAAGGGVPVHAELEDEDGRVAFSVGLAVENKVREISLDPKSGQVVQDEVEQEDQARIAAAVKIPLQTLVDKVLESTAGRAVEAEFELKGGRLRAEIKVYGPEGLREVKVDGETGEILSTKAAEKKENSK